MAPDWFFLSYARLDRDDDPFECVRKFYADLDREIVRKKVIKAGNAGFYDGTGLQQGDDWPVALGAALNSCRVLVALYSPAYFDSEYCGKELAVFNSRIDSYLSSAASGTARPTIVLPVLLDPPNELGQIPDVLKDTQFIDDKYPAVYREEGLRYLFRRTNSELKDRYQDFLDVLVAKLLAAAQLQVPQLAALPPIKTLSSAFHAPVTGPVMPVISETSGPRYAEFVYVAGRRTEIQPLGRNVDNYGDEGELDWKPYSPESPDEVGLIAQTVATNERFRYRSVSLSGTTDLLDSIASAETNNRIFIIIVDTWTLRLQKYSQLMQNYDRVNFGNSAVLVVWNDKDDETVKNRQVLEFEVRRSFINKARTKDPNSFIDTIGKPPDLVTALSIALQKISAQIVENNRLRRIETGAPIAKPEINPGSVTQ